MFRNAKSDAARLGLFLLGALVLMAAPAAGLLAQTNAPSAGAVQAQPAAAVATSNAVTPPPAIALPGGVPGSGLIGSPRNGLPGGAPSSAIIGSPANGFPGGAFSSVKIGSSTTWRPARPLAGTNMATLLTNLPGRTASRSGARSPAASLAKAANAKTASVKPFTNSLPRAAFVGWINTPALRTINALRQQTAAQTPMGALPDYRGLPDKMEENGVTRAGGGVYCTTFR